jgi:hypothetical protein
MHQGNAIGTPRTLTRVFTQPKIPAQRLFASSHDWPNTGALPLYQASLGHAYAVAGRRDEAQRLLTQLNERSKQVYVSAYELGILYTGLGEKERAFAALQVACDQHSGRVYFLNVDPRLDPLRPDPRFQDLLRRAGLQP